MELIEEQINSLLDAQPKLEDQRKREIGHFWASELGKCERQVYYSFTNPKIFPSSKMRPFKIGSVVHDYLQTLLKKQEGILFKEVWNEAYMMITDTETDLVITGKIDTKIIPLEGTGDSYILEFKTENERAYELRKEPLVQHICQITLYMRSQRMKYGYIVYVSKSGMDMKFFRIDYDEETFQNLLKSARDIYWHVLHSKLPVKQPSEKWQCAYCLWKDDCAKSENPALKSRLFPAKVAESEIVGDVDVNVKG